VLEVVPEAVLEVAVLLVLVGVDVLVLVGVEVVLLELDVVVGVELEVDVDVLDLVVVVVVLWVVRQSCAASTLTVDAPCLRLFVSVGLTDGGKSTTALLNVVTASAAGPHWPLLTAD